MNNNKIAIFLDIDGTLYSSKLKDLPSSTKEILKELSSDENIDLYIASGRSMNTINSLKENFSHFKGFVLTNGQDIYIDSEEKFKGSIEFEQVKAFVSYCTLNDYSVVILTSCNLYYNKFSKKVEENFEEYIKEKVYPIKNIEELKDIKIPQMWLFTTNEENDLIRKAFPSLNIINWGTLGADVLPIGASKGEGVKKVIEKMGYELSNTFAIGDSDNDVEMFKIVGTSICMGNGTMKAKQAATFVGYDIDDDGLMKNINEFILKK